ncbi:MAG: hypothetical protein KGJ57_17490 [Sphingomonadales bacterium]|nr:hypothetical protein [Sphingomonadales bacterium]MDE2171192.1 hypothetical protein [Sphingomonadales bacterium]
MNLVQKLRDLERKADQAFADAMAAVHRGDSQAKINEYRDKVAAMHDALAEAFMQDRVVILAALELAEKAPGLPDRPEWWVRKEGVWGCKRFVPDRIMRRWEVHPTLSGMVQYYVPACTACPAVRANDEPQ